MKSKRLSMMPQTTKRQPRSLFPNPYPSLLYGKLLQNQPTAFRNNAHNHRHRLSQTPMLVNLHPRFLRYHDRQMGYLEVD